MLYMCSMIEPVSACLQKDLITQDFKCIACTSAVILPTLQHYLGALANGGRPQQLVILSIGCL